MSTDIAAQPATSVRQLALDSARAGLDFLVRQQVSTGDSADMGRFPFTYDCSANRILTLSTNWTTGIGIAALLAGYRAFSDERYLQAAGRAVRYLFSIQSFSPFSRRVRGVFREVTGQSSMAHPRDALTAAWALADWSQIAGDQEAFDRARIYADWFVEVGMERGYPYWTVRFDDQPWEPGWCGSFHSGSAYFMYRMFRLTGEARYRTAMRTILDFYNQHHLAADGSISVILDRNTFEKLDGKVDPRIAPRGWEMMHVYNDDFGALANLAAWKLEKDDKYSSAAGRFLRRMVDIQRADGGFGPEAYSVPSAGGAVLLELAAARKLGLGIGTDESLAKAVQYLLNLQVRREGDPADGAYRGCTSNYTLDERICNIRSGAYAIMGLLHFAQAAGGIYGVD